MNNLWYQKMAIKLVELGNWRDTLSWTMKQVQPQEEETTSHFLTENDIKRKQGNWEKPNTMAKTKLPGWSRANTTCSSKTQNRTVTHIFQTLTRKQWWNTESRLKLSRQTREKANPKPLPRILKINTNKQHKKQFSKPTITHKHILKRFNTLVIEFCWAVSWSPTSNYLIPIGSFVYLSIWEICYIFSWVFPYILYVFFILL